MACLITNIAHAITIARSLTLASLGRDMHSLQAAVRLPWLVAKNQYRAPMHTSNRNPQFFPIVSCESVRPTDDVKG